MTETPPTPAPQEPERADAEASVGDPPEERFPHLHGDEMWTGFEAANRDNLIGGDHLVRSIGDMAQATNHRLAGSDRRAIVIVLGGLLGIVVLLLLLAVVL